MEREDWQALLMVGAAIVVAVVGGYLIVGWPPQPPQDPLAPEPSASPTSAARKMPTVAVLGDSFSARSAASKGPEWPSIVGDDLGWKVVSDAVDGSGYVTAGGGQRFPQRVKPLLRESPDVIVVAGGYHDVRSYAVPAVTDAAQRLVSRLVSQAPDAEVVVVSPFAAGAPGPLTQQFSRSLRRIAQNQGLAYVDATRWLPTSSLVGPDGVHPTEQGQRRIATRMEQALKRLGLREPSGQPTG